MNGKDLLEAMSFVDEAYIEDAQQSTPAKRFHWQSVAATAAAACFVVVMYGWYTVNTRLSMISQAEVKGPAFEMEAMVVPIQSEMTVRIDGYENGLLLCTVTASGTSRYPVGTQLRIAPPESNVTQDTTASTKEPGEYRITFRQDAEEILQAIEITPVNK